MKRFALPKQRRATRKLPNQGRSQSWPRCGWSRYWNAVLSSNMRTTQT
jgi:hypothetical protein